MTFERVTHFKFLDVVFKENITWTDHVNKISKEISRYTGQIFSTRSFSNTVKKATTLYMDPLAHPILYS